MSPSATFFVCSFFLLSLILQQGTSYLSSGRHINDVEILLPPKMSNPVEYRLLSGDGCFEWSWDHHDLLLVLPEFSSSSNCSISARLRSIAPYCGRMEIAVYANDVRTRELVSWKIYIDNISSIQIVYKPINLVLDEVAVLRVHAFDAQGSIFSSLVGVQFMWQSKPESDGQPNSLVHVPLKDYPLSDCGGSCDDLNIQVKLEESGVFSDFYVVKGVEIGSDIVSVNLLEPSVGSLTNKIALTVAEAMSLDPPSPVYLLIGADLHYTLRVIRSGSLQVVSLPSPFHQWSSLNSSVAEVDTANGTVRALNLGVTTIVVKDTRARGNMQISSLHVVIPNRLLLFMSPLSLSGDLVEGFDPISSESPWYVMADHSYLIHVKVFSSGSRRQEIYVTESVEIELHDSREGLWKIQPFFKGATANCRILDAKLCGFENLTATLTYKTGHDIREDKVLDFEKEVMVCEQVQFIMDGFDRILLPWIPDVHQELELRVRGGCAMSSQEYNWFSSDKDVVSIPTFGIVRADELGKVTIRAGCLFDSMNYDDIIVEVLMPDSMVMLPSFPVETAVGTYLQASVTLKASNGAYFYTCDALKYSVEWTTDIGSFIIVNATAIVSDKQEAVHSRSYGPPCAWTKIYASSSGRTVVHATLTREKTFPDHSGAESVTLKVSSSIAAYSPLVVQQASDGNHFGGYWFDLAHTEPQNQPSNLDYLYLAPGTHSDVMLRGGPERWGNDVEFVEDVQVFAEQNGNAKDRIVIHQMSTDHGNSYRIRCEILGTFKLIFRRGNLVGEDHHLRVVPEVQLLLMCSFPSSIVIITDETFNAPRVIQSAAQAGRMPNRIRTSPVTVANERRIRVSAVGLSDSGKAFANSSSLYLSWKLTACEGLARLEDDYGSTEYSSWERFLILQNTTGLCIVRGNAVSFINSLSHFDFAMIFKASKITLTDAIQLQLIRATTEFGLFSSSEARLNILVTDSDEFSVHLLSLGTELDPPIEYHETLGNPFDEGHNIKLLEVETNRPDVVSIEQYDGHGNIHIRAKGQGSAVVRVSFVGNPRKSVYAIIFVGGRKIVSPDAVTPSPLLKNLALGCTSILTVVSSFYFFGVGGFLFNPIKQYLARRLEEYIVCCLQGLMDGGIQGFINAAFQGFGGNRIQRLFDRGIQQLHVYCMEQVDQARGILARGVNIQEFRRPHNQAMFAEHINNIGRFFAPGVRESVIRGIQDFFDRYTRDPDQDPFQELHNPRGHELVVHGADGNVPRGVVAHYRRALNQERFGPFQEFRDPAGHEFIVRLADGVRGFFVTVLEYNRRFLARYRPGVRGFFVTVLEYNRRFLARYRPGINRELPARVLTNGPANDVENELEPV